MCIAIQCILHRIVLDFMIRIEHCHPGYGQTWNNVRQGFAECQINFKRTFYGRQHNGYYKGMPCTDVKTARSLVRWDESHKSEAGLRPKEQGWRSNASGISWTTQGLDIGPTAWSQPGPLECRRVESGLILWHAQRRAAAAFDLRAEEWTMRRKLIACVDLHRPFYHDKRTDKTVVLGRQMPFAHSRLIRRAGLGRESGGPTEGVEVNDRVIQILEHVWCQYSKILFCHLKVIRMFYGLHLWFGREHGALRINWPWAYYGARSFSWVIDPSLSSTSKRPLPSWLTNK